MAERNPHEEANRRLLQLTHEQVADIRKKASSQEYPQPVKFKKGHSAETPVPQKRKKRTEFIPGFSKPPTDKQIDEAW